MFIFLRFGRGACYFFGCLGGGSCVCFAVWAGTFFFLLFGRGGSVFFCCLGGGREFTHLPVCLARL